MSWVPIETCSRCGAAFGGAGNVEGLCAACLISAAVDEEETSSSSSHGDSLLGSLTRGSQLGPFEIEARVGTGGMGQVFLARDTALGRRVALKIIRAGMELVLRERLLLEAANTARLQHPAIATFYDAGEADGKVFLAMEYVEGETLRDRLKRGPLAVPDALSLAAGLLEALSHAHAAGVLHRDIKPENIMLAEGGSVKLLDFGLAKALTRSTEGVDSEMRTATQVPGLTGEGMLVGTIGYMSPEQLRAEPL